MTKLGKLLAPVINGWPINRAKHAIRYISRTRDLEKMAAGEVFAIHGWVLAVSD